MIRLNEVVWEITDRCTNNCSYCGSKDRKNHVSRDDEKYEEIARAIAKYPPHEVNISGGDPLLIGWLNHKKVTDILKAAGIKTKILVNPQSFEKYNNPMPYGEAEWSAILDLYDGVGISVNTEEEMVLFATHISREKRPTIITNFNKSNLWLFNSIAELVDHHLAYWQIQLTMYKEKGHPLAIYESDIAAKELSDKIKKCRSRYIVADNFNDGPCGAGMSSYGVLCNGDVIPCLSMVSWTDAPVQGNLLKESAGEIWETSFRDWRFGTPKCCKDHCNRKCHTGNNTNIIDSLKGLIKTPPVEIKPYYPMPSTPVIPPDFDRGMVMMYAVITRDWNPNSNITKVTTSIQPGDDIVWVDAPSTPKKDG